MCLSANIDWEKEIIVVDDASTDGTKESLKDIGNDNIKLVFHERNQGKGSAIRTGLSLTSGSIILIQDADLEYNPEDYCNQLCK